MRSRHSYTFLLMISIATTCVVFGVYAYMTHTLSTSVAASLAAREAVASAQANKNREQAFMQVYQSTASSWARLPTFFIPSNNAVSFIEAIESLGGQTGATVALSAINADTLDSAAAGTLGKIGAHVDVNGTWSAVMRTLELAEILPFKASVGNIHLDEESTDKAGKHIWRMSFDVTAGLIAAGPAKPTASSTPTIH